MTIKQEKTGKRDLATSRMHRELGKHLYSTDVDNLEYAAQGQFVEYAFSDKKTPYPVAWIDYKHGSAKEIDETTSIALQRSMAFGLNLPFFVVLSYLEIEEGQPYDPQCYFVVPLNHYAKTALKRFSGKEDRDWFSLKRYSKFLHFLHGKQWREISFDEELGSLSDETTKPNGQHHHLPLILL